MKPFQKNSLLTIILAAVALTGCGTTPTAPQYKTVVIAPDDNQLVDCLVVEPPEKAAYVAATPKEREKLLIDLADKQMKNSFLCNDRWAKVRQWKKQQLENQQKHNPKGE